jgi:DNA (cytosine-5)-methyltransferase 1
MTASLSLSAGRLAKAKLTQMRIDPKRKTTSLTNADSKRTRGPTKTAAEFFAGIGLMRLALERQGWEIRFANDNDPRKAATYRANFPGDRLSTADIRDLSAADVPDCTLYTASFPCNDLSIAGAMRGLNGSQSRMFWELVRIVRGKRNRKPPLILLENVVGFLMSRGGADLEAALCALNDLGYATDAFILNASSFVPQSRARLFVIAKLVARHSAETPAPSGARPKALTDFIRRRPTSVGTSDRSPNRPRARTN